MNAPTVQILNGDVLDHLHKLPDESVHCCVTSPPYWGLRDYSRCGCAVNVGGAYANTTMCNQGPMLIDPRNEKQPNPLCPICHGTGKIVGTERQLGLEPTPEQYIANMVQVFHEVKRVLRKDGTCWVNMGDCYYGSWGNSGAREGGQRTVTEDRLDREAWDNHTERPASSFKHELYKPKNLVGQPWRLAFALQADGWYLRSDIIWAKPNPMPESVTDRPTKAHEYIFLLSKSPRYFYDQEAVREKQKPDTEKWNARYDLKLIKGVASTRTDGDNIGYFSNPAGRNSRTVWEIATQPYPEAHFATFPEELPRRCIKAGTSEKGCCPKCGSPWERIVEAKEARGSYHDHSMDLIGGQSQPKPNNICGQDWYDKDRSTKTLGWQPTCSCGMTETTPCTVLDPFAGSGTTGAVARSMGRSSILIELNPEYVKLIKERCDTDHVALDSFAEEAVE